MLAVERKGEILRCLSLEIFAPPVIFPSCRFTSFIAKSANATAKSSSAPAIGRERSVRTAVQRNCPRSFPCSPPPAPAATARRHVTAAAVDVVAAIATGIEIFGRVGHVADQKFRDGDTPSLPRFQARLHASDLQPPNRADAVSIHPASPRRWPRPALSR